jgi:hypothetical protein
VFAIPLLCLREAGGICFIREFLYALRLNGLFCEEGEQEHDPGALAGQTRQ